MFIYFSQRFHPVFEHSVLLLFLRDPCAPRFSPNCVCANLRAHQRGWKENATAARCLWFPQPKFSRFPVSDPGSATECSSQWILCRWLYETEAHSWLVHVLSAIYLHFGGLPSHIWRWDALTGAAGALSSTRVVRSCGQLQ